MVDVIRLKQFIGFAKDLLSEKMRAPEDVARNAPFCRFQSELAPMQCVEAKAQHHPGGDIWFRIKKMAWTEGAPRPSGELEPYLEEEGENDKPRALRPDWSLRYARIDAAGSERNTSSLVQKLYDEYSNNWHEWSRLACGKRKIYEDLFRLRSELENSLQAEELELLCGLGVMLWGKYRYPLVMVPMVFRLERASGDLLLGPSDGDPRLELSWLKAQGKTGLEKLHESFESLVGSEDSDFEFSPFKLDELEPLLQTAVCELDPNGRLVEDSEVPQVVDSAGGSLRVHKSWLIAVRPRRSHALIRDLDTFAETVDSMETAPPLIEAVLGEPSDQPAETRLSPFRGFGDTWTLDGDKAAGETLYFPKAYNEEQRRIIQTLERSSAVVVQGPPGTGKTHTIANIICHNLAHGRKVLVTSMKEPALRVLRDQLPEELRAFCVTVLGSGEEGRELLERAVERICAVAQEDRRQLELRVQELELHMEQLHEEAWLLGRTIRERSSRCIEKLSLDGKSYTPEEAARAVARDAGQLHLVPDAIDLGPECEPSFSLDQLRAVSDAWKRIGKIRDWLARIPPRNLGRYSLEDILEVHHTLRRGGGVRRRQDLGQLPTVDHERLREVEDLAGLVERLKRFREMRQRLGNGNPALMAAFRGVNPEILKIGEKLWDRLEEHRSGAAGSLSRNVTGLTPPFPESLRRCIENQARGKRPLGFFGMLGNADVKQKLNQILVGAAPPVTPEQWGKVLEEVAYLVNREDIKSQFMKLVQLLEGGNSGHLLGRVGIDEVLRACSDFMRDLVEQRELSHMLTELFPSAVLGQGPATDFGDYLEVLQHELDCEKWRHALEVEQDLIKTTNICSGALKSGLSDLVNRQLGKSCETEEIEQLWRETQDKLTTIESHRNELDAINAFAEACRRKGAVRLARVVESLEEKWFDSMDPHDFVRLWDSRRLRTYLSQAQGGESMLQLWDKKTAIEAELKKTAGQLIDRKTRLGVVKSLTEKISSSLKQYEVSVRKLGKGTGTKRAPRYRRDAKNAAREAAAAIPCWIMSHEKVSETLPAHWGAFDLVIVDEASQSDASAIPAILRGRKLLVVGDEKQVSPSHIGNLESNARILDEEARRLGVSFLPDMIGDKSFYDACTVRFSANMVMLREHFRCAEPIIEYSKEKFYNGQLIPIRVPQASERLDPPLLDVFVVDGCKRKDVNAGEADFIVDEIRRLGMDPATRDRTVGVVTLLGQEQAKLILGKLLSRVGGEELERRKIVVAHAPGFQGNERDIMFLSLVCDRDGCAPLSAEMSRQRFNVAGSRARDRMYLVRSVKLDDLSPADTLRRGLLEHFRSPFRQDPNLIKESKERCESEFEKDMFTELTSRGYRVLPQVGSENYRIDLVVEGEGNRRLAVECDGDHYHGPEHWVRDIARQRVLERAGWTFWRCFASRFYLERDKAVQELVGILERAGIRPVATIGPSNRSYLEHKVVKGGQVITVEAPDQDPAADAELGSPEVHQVRLRQSSTQVTAGIGSESVPPTGGSSRVGLASSPSAEFLQWTSEPRPATSEGRPVARESHPMRGRPPSSAASMRTPPHESSRTGPSRQLSLLSTPLTQGRDGFPAAAKPVRPLAEVGAPAHLSLARESGDAPQGYRVYEGPLPGTGSVSNESLAEAMLHIAQTEAPVVAERVYRLISENLTQSRDSDQNLNSRLNKALSLLEQRKRVRLRKQVVGGLYRHRIIELADSPTRLLRYRGPRLLDEIPLSELAAWARYVADEKGIDFDSREFNRALAVELALGDQLEEVKNRFMYLRHHATPEVLALLGDN